MSLSGTMIAFLVTSDGVAQVESTQPGAPVEQDGGPPVSRAGGHRGG